MNDLRPATQEEVAKIAPVSDLGFTEHEVWALDNANGTTNYFVMKLERVLDPVLFDPSVPKNMKSMILWMVNNFLKGRGWPCYYFGIHAENQHGPKCVTCQRPLPNPDDVAFRESMMHHGAEDSFGVPAWRLKKTLVEVPKAPQPVPAVPTVFADKKE